MEVTISNDITNQVITRSKIHGNVFCRLCMVHGGGNTVWLLLFSNHLCGLSCMGSCMCGLV